MKPISLPLDGLEVLTGETGIFQHAKFSRIDLKEGYTIDDNARALIAALRYHRDYKTQSVLSLANIYLAFLLYMQRKDGRFHNFLEFDWRFTDEVGARATKQLPPL